MLWACLLDGCGFQLQGSADLPNVMAVTYVQAPDAYTDVVRGLNRSLKSSGVQVTQNPDDATAVLVIHRDHSGQRILTVSSENEPLEYEVFYTVTYELRVNGKSVLPSETLTRRHTYTFNKNEVLGMRQQEQDLHEAIADDLVRTITRRLATFDESRLSSG